MARNTYRKIDTTLKEILSLNSSIDLFEDNFREVENLMISASLYFLSNNSVVNKSSTKVVREISPENFAQELLVKYKEFHFLEYLKIDREILKKILKLVKKEGFIAPGLIHEYFLENFPDGKRIESKRKKTGIYYTPGWVAKDMVCRNLGDHLKKKLNELRRCKKECDYERFIEIWKSVSEIKILDPACGWGIFLLNVYKNLHNFYKSAGIMAGKMLEDQACQLFDEEDMLSEGYSRMVQLSVDLKNIASIGRDPSKIISTNNIYGYDIDKTALDISGCLLDNQGSNSGKEDSNQWNLLEKDFIIDFDGIGERFDLIIGNPPYFSIGGGGRGKTKTKYHNVLKNHSFFSEHFRSQSDIFYYFIIGGIEILKPGGNISFITPSYWIDNEYADTLKKMILEKCHIEEIISFDPLGVFHTLRGKKVNIDTAVFRYKKKYVRPDNEMMEIIFKFTGQDASSCISPLGGSGKSSFPVYKPPMNADGLTAKGFLESIRKNDGICEDGKNFHIIIKEHNELSRGKWVFSRYNDILAKMKKNGKTILPLGDISRNEYEKYRGEFENPDKKHRTGICRIGQGQETGLSRVFIIDKDKARKLNIEKEILKPNIKNGHVLRYGLEDSRQFMILIKKDEDILKYPNIRNYLENHRDMLLSRQRVKIGRRKWFEISIPQNMEIFQKPEKILVPYRSRYNRFAIDRNRHLNDGGDVRAIIIRGEFRDTFSYNFLLALLNSRLITFWYMQSGKKKGRMYEYFTHPISRIPIFIPDPQSKKEVEKMSREIQDLYREIRKSTHISSNEKIKLQSKIDKLEKDIDIAVYRLYNISNEEIEQIESYLTGNLPYRG